MKRSFLRMDKEVIACNEIVDSANYLCELQTPACDAVGSTAVAAIVTPDKIIVANCGDSRGLLYRKGKVLPLSSDHKGPRFGSKLSEARTRSSSCGIVIGHSFGSPWKIGSGAMLMYELGEFDAEVSVMDLDGCKENWTVGVGLMESE